MGDSLSYLDKCNLLIEIIAWPREDTKVPFDC